MKKSVNLVNVKIVEDRIANIEILYKTDNEIHNIKAYLKLNIKTIILMFKHIHFHKK